MEQDKFFVRKQERMRGAGTHVIAAQQVAFPAAALSEASTSINSATRSPSPSLRRQSASAVAGPSRSAKPTAPQGTGTFFERMDERRQERMRGAGTHVIAAQPVAFPSASPSEASTADTREETSNNDADSSATHVGKGGVVRGANRTSFLDVDVRRLGRMRGAGTHKILEQKVDFPEASSVISSVGESIQSNRFENTSIALGGSQSFDDSMIDPRLRSGDVTTTTSSRIESIPMESTPGLPRKRPAPSRSKKNRAFESFFDEDGVSDIYEYPARKQHQSLHRQSDRDVAPAPTLGAIARQQRREEQEDEVRRRRERMIMEQLGVRSAVPTDVHDDPRADLTLQEQVGLRAQSSSAAASMAKQRPSFWVIPHGGQSAAKQEAARAEFRDIISLAVGDRMTIQTQGLRSNDADVLYTIIKRHFQQAASTSPRVAAHAEMLDAILGRLIVTFRHLSRQAADRAKLIQQLGDARRKMLAMRKLCFQKRNHVMRVMRTVDALYQEQVARERKTKHDNDMYAFLTDVRDKASAWALKDDTPQPTKRRRTGGAQ